MTTHDNTIHPTAGLFTFAQVASVFGKSERTMTRWVQKGLINTVIVGNRAFISEQEYERVKAEIGEITPENVKKYYERTAK